VTDFGLFIDIYNGLEGLAHISEIEVPPGSKLEDHYKVGDWVRTRILRIEEDDKKVGLSMRGAKSAFTVARKAGAKLTVAMELGSNGAIKHAVESGLGLAVISRYACALEFSSGRLVELDVRGFPIRRDWHIVHLRRRKLPTSVTAFIEFLKDTSWLSRNGSRGRVRPPTD